MLEQIDRNATGVVPAPERAAAPVVAVHGPQTRVAGLARHLPAGWSLRRLDDLGSALPGELVVLAGATEPAVRTARATLPRAAQIIALIDDRGPAEQVAAVLGAGADVCVRGEHPAVLAGHLVACRRRQLAGRWAALDLAAG